MIEEERALIMVYYREDLRIVSWSPRGFENHALQFCYENSRAPSKPATARVCQNMSTKKKVDSRVRTLIENGAKSHHRSLFVITGDHSKDKVVNLHYVFLSKSQVRSKPTALWCYKKIWDFLLIEKENEPD